MSYRDRKGHNVGVALLVSLLDQGYLKPLAAGFSSLGLKVCSGMQLAFVGKVQFCCVPDVDIGFLLTFRPGESVLPVFGILDMCGCCISRGAFGPGVSKNPL